MKNKLTTVFTFLFVLFAICSAFFGAPGETGESIYDSIAVTQEAAYSWEGGPLDELAPGMAIGGDHFGNYENSLPATQGRSYWECDIDTIGADDRGTKRIVYSNDGLVYYTEDHYESFERLYGEP